MLGIRSSAQLRIRPGPADRGCHQQARRLGHPRDPARSPAGATFTPSGTIRTSPWRRSSPPPSTWIHRSPDTSALIAESRMLLRWLEGARPIDIDGCWALRSALQDRLTRSSGPGRVAAAPESIAWVTRSTPSRMRAAVLDLGGAHGRPRRPRSGGIGDHDIAHRSPPPANTSREFGVASGVPTAAGPTRAIGNPERLRRELRQAHLRSRRPTRSGTPGADLVEAVETAPRAPAHPALCRTSAMTGAMGPKAHPTRAAAGRAGLASGPEWDVEEGRKWPDPYGLAGEPQSGMEDRREAQNAMPACSRQGPTACARADRSPPLRASSTSADPDCDDAARLPC